ncbi:hypothetical protein [Treponema pedis]|uniref:hypothetical protein n=1 Tax=Treponema pedis TaxID=409322 RepID=UPI000465B0C5|nr:hypothetical protein [Treponema pedis]
MEFGWINILGFSIVLLILIPNVIYTAKQKKDKMKMEVPHYLTVCEQVGRYSCIVLMWLPLLVWKFGFESEEEFLIYLIANGVLLLGYYLLWVLYARKKTLSKAMALAIIPTMIFFLSGVLLHHWFLVVVASLFGFAHGKITYMTHK